MWCCNVNVRYPVIKTKLVSHRAESGSQCCGLTVPWITGSLLSWQPWLASNQVDIMLCLTQLTTLYTRKLVPFSTDVSFMPSQSSLASLDHMRSCSWELCNIVTCWVTLAHDNLGWADWALAQQQTGPGPLPELSISQTSSHTKYYVAHALTVHCNDNIEANRMLITMLCWMNK